MLACHECFSVGGILLFHERMMMKEVEKGTMLEGIFEGARES